MHLGDLYLRYAPSSLPFYALCPMLYALCPFPFAPRPSYYASLSSVIYKMKYFLLLLFLPSALFAQVPNDDIRQAKVLEIGEPISSSTAYSTIQASCVNYALTKKCIKYHNDQWFIVNSQKRDFLYINIQNQECRDLLGVQLVAIEGEACDIENYKILECISFGSNDDFYVRLDSLKPDTDYLLNIDGYLKDFCSFAITADTIPYGIPNEVNLELKSEGELDANIVKLNWNLATELENKILHFEVMERTEEFKHEVVDKIPVTRNTYGYITKDYFYTDTLKDNLQHFYKLIAVDQQGKKYLVDEFKFKDKTVKKHDFIVLHLGYRKGTSLTLSIYEKDSKQIFRRARFFFDPLKHSNLTYSVGSLIEEGVKAVVVEVKNNKTQEVITKEYLLQ